MIKIISKLLQSYIIFYKRKNLSQVLEISIQKFVREKQTLIDFVNTSILLMFTLINILHLHYLKTFLKLFRNAQFLDCVHFLQRLIDLENVWHSIEKLLGFWGFFPIEESLHLTKKKVGRTMKTA